jgi:Protein of unknown function (DUF2490)
LTRVHPSAYPSPLHSQQPIHFRRIATLPVTVFLAVFGSIPLPAQTISDGRVWWNATLQERSGTESPWRWYFEVQGRMRDGADALDQLLIRPAIAYELTSRSSVWAGYGYTPQFPASGGALYEHRAWQQYLWNRPLGKLQLTSRSRLEERFMEGNGELAWRFRQQLRFTRPVRSSRFSALFWDEFLTHLNTTNRTTRGFDQNRIFAGTGIALDSRARIEIGYMNQYLNGIRAPNRSNHTLSIVLNLTF